MKYLLVIMGSVAVGSGLVDSNALDAPPPPEVKTLQWTIEMAGRNIPDLTMEDTPISAALDGMASSMAMPGFYLQIDQSEVEERAKERINIKVEEITWLGAVAMLADKIDCGIQINPGVIKLVPRESIFTGKGVPGKEMIGDWNAFSQQFMKWEIVEFDGWGRIADGTTIGFRFKTSDESELGVLVVNRGWWSEEGQKLNRQAIFLRLDGKVYHVPKDHKFERALLEKLGSAAANLKGEGYSDTKYIKLLRERIESRIPFKTGWPSPDVSSPQEVTPVP